jgi:hypothetical protein
LPANVPNVIEGSCRECCASRTERLEAADARWVDAWAASDPGQALTPGRRVLLTRRFGRSAARATWTTPLRGEVDHAKDVGDQQDAMLAFEELVPEAI